MKITKDQIDKIIKTALNTDEAFTKADWGAYGATDRHGQDFIQICDGAGEILFVISVTEI